MSTITSYTLSTRGFSRVRREFSVLAEDQHIFARSSAPSFRAGHYKDLTETGNRARKVSGTHARIQCGATATCTLFGSIWEFKK